MTRIASSVALPLAGVLAGGLFWPATAPAAEWTRGAGLTLGSYYSSNICRSPDEEQGEPVGTVTPRLNVRAEGSRANFALRGAVEYNTLGESDIDCPAGGFGNIANRETWVPRGDAFGEIEAVENFFYLEADAFAAQNPINPFAAGGNDNINATGNTNITYRWGAGARIDRQYGEAWSTLIRYNYNEQYNSINRLLGDTQEDRVELDVGMIPSASRLSAGVRGNYSEVTFEEREGLPEFDNRLARLELRAALNLSRQWQVNGFVGEEDNNFLSAQDEIDGDYWDLGLRFTPNERVTLDAGYGERFFGNTPRFAIDYRHKRTNLRAEYIRDLQFPRNIRGAGGAFDPDDPLDPGLGNPGEPLPGAGNPTFLGQGPVLNEFFALTYRFSARRTTFTLRASDSEQTRAIDNRGGEFQSVNMTASRRIGFGTTLDLGVTYRENEGSLRFGGIAGDAQQGLEAWRGSLGLRKKLAGNTLLTLRYDYTDQQSTGAGDAIGGNFNSFEEHRISLSLRFDFGQPGSGAPAQGGGAMRGGAAPGR